MRRTVSTGINSNSREHGAISLGILYLFYTGILRQVTWFRMNRLYLVTSILFSLVLPLISIPVKGDTSLPVQVITLDEIRITASSSVGTISSFGIWNVILYIYLIGAGLFFIRFIINLLRIYAIRWSGGLIRLEGLRIVLTDKNFSTFSFLNNIFLNSKNASKSGASTSKRLSMMEKQDHQNGQSIRYCLPFRLPDYYFLFLRAPRKSP